MPAPNGAAGAAGVGGGVLGAGVLDTVSVSGVRTRPGAGSGSDSGTGSGLGSRGGVGSGGGASVASPASPASAMSSASSASSASTSSPGAASGASRWPSPPPLCPASSPDLLARVELEAYLAVYRVDAEANTADLLTAERVDATADVQVLSDEEIQRVFDALDINKNGLLSRSELGIGLRSLNLRPSDDAEDEIWAALMEHDVDNTGDVSFCEFRRFALFREMHLRDLFNKIDQNKDGELQVDEVVLALEEYGVEADYGVVKDMLRQTDAEFGNNDGKFTFADFRRMSLLLPSHHIEQIFHHSNAAFLLGVEKELYSIPKDDYHPNRRGDGPATHPLTIFLAGGIAGLVSRTATAPMDRVKCLLQAGTEGRGATVGSTFRSIMNEGGAAAFWRGNGANVVKIMPESAFKFYFNECFKAWIVHDPNSVRVHERLIAGSLAGITAQTAIYPMEVVKTRLAVSPPGLYSGIYQCATAVTKYEGVSALYKGLGASNLGIIPYAGVDLAVYGTLKQSWMTKHPDRDPKWYETLLMGTASSFTGQLCAYPLQLIRTRLQSSGIPGARKYNGIREVAAEVMEREGPKGFYRGISANFMKGIPAVAIGYVAFEQSQKFITSATAGER